jgi:serine/threonine-protein kinase
MTVNDTSKVGTESEADDDGGGVPGANANDALPAGATLSDTYEIVEQVALGGMAQVYRARNIHTDEPVAIKLVLPEFARDKTIIALFKKEATVLSRLHHDAIVNYHMFTIEPRMKRPYLVMEFVDGVHLGDFFRTAPLDAESCRTLMIRVASGLAAAHDAGVIHRDLSPDNVILPDGDVAKTKIIDFGIAKAAAVGEGTLLGGKFAGKYNFVSPEQLGLGGGEITERSDIYSLGLIAAAAMLGRALDMSGSHVQVLDKRRVIPDLTGVDPAVRPAIEAMLEPLPDDRPHDMRAVIELWANTTIFAGDGKTVITVDPWTTTPPQRSMPPQRSTAPRSVPPASVPPQPSMPPQQSLPPAASWDVASPPTTPPVQSGSTVVADRSGMPDPSMPPQRSMPPEYTPPSARSLPPLPGAPPQSSVPPQTSVPPPPPPLPGGGATVVGEAAPAGSESPFGPYVDRGAKFQLPPEKAGPAKGKGPPVALIGGIAALVVVAGGLGLAFTQNWFGGPGGAASGQPGSGGTTVSRPEQVASQPETPAAPQTPATPQTAPATETPPSTAVPAATSAPPAVSGQPTTQPAGGGTLQAAGGDATQPMAPVAPVTSTVPAVTATPAVPDNETTAASGPGTPLPGLTKAATQLAWLDAYPLGKCAYVHATKVADNAFGIEAYGDSASPFKALATDFKKANGVDPEIGVRLLDQTQCPVADFLQEVKAQPLAQPTQAADSVPSLTLSNGSIEDGDTLAGWIAGTAGWHTELLLVDYGGGVQNITPVLQESGKTMRFTLPGLATDSPTAVPLVLIAVAGRDGPVEAAQFDQTFAAGAILPKILHEVEADPGNFAISPAYFQIKPAKAASN